jgi:hypothetical protein
MADSEFTDREKRFIEALRESALSDNPNPERVGCPDQKKLQAVARRQVSLMDPALEHVWQCSPCAQEVLRYREAARNSKRVWVAAAIVAATLAIVVLGFIWQTSRPRNVAQSPAPFSPVPPLTKPEAIQTMAATLDLRPFSTTRGASKKTAQTLSLKRDVVTLKLYLPIGLEEGRYDLRVMDDQLQSRLTQSAVAELTDHIVTLDTQLDLRSLEPGRYVLALRPAGEDWRTFPLILQ